jgi:hypothetical protein
LGSVRVELRDAAWRHAGSRPHPNPGSTMAKILSNVQSDKLSFVFLLVVLVSTFLF